ncbi:hypothetical protein GIY09_11660 [Aerococcaceae bacterium WS4759]|uniref:Polysaccharide pyruvyl transferase domain-containing protein n=1 Tax=Fundicoccus ignavus TaxID=2664442 RepID=A0A6I2GLN8_9LACT|nr:polysaccharide pyruvyl transferase family protein [Fundicoccus ignavus]MRI86501.1 hypothetical protein [Fundicoccus ignavus]
MKSVGIITYHCADNFGGVLQVYALMKTIEQLGLRAEIIDFQPKEITYQYSPKFDIEYSLETQGLVITLKGMLKRLQNKSTLQEKSKNFSEFREKHLRLSMDTYLTEISLKENPPKYDFYITGSDQVWNPDLFEKIGNSYFLDFASPESTKISYAASIAKKVENEYADVFRDNLERFNYVSVREESAKLYLEDKTDKEVKVTIDPTLLLSKNDWVQISTYNKNDEKFILVYDLVKDPVIVSVANKIAKDNGYKIISYSIAKEYENWKGSFSTNNPTDFLGLVEKSEVIVTSSFHGTAFSIIYNKPFYTVPHPTRGSRMVDFLNKLQLSDRMVTDVSQLDEMKLEIDYTKVNKKLIELRNDSLEFLKIALGIEK